jgi:DNA-binding LacI/PurR family transcriptional regulator
MVSGLLMELDDHNCQTIAEAAGHRGPHRLQHLLSRAVWDDRQVLDTASAWAVEHLDDGDAVLIVDETADEKSSADAAGRALLREAARGDAGGLGFSAVFCANDQMALGLIHAFREAGLDVPRDVSVAGFDDIPESAHFWPPLTTVRQDFVELGARCVTLLAGRSAGRTAAQALRARAFRASRAPKYETQRCLRWCSPSWWSATPCAPLTRPDGSLTLVLGMAIMS